MTRLLAGSSYGFVAQRRRAYAVAGVLLLAGIAAILLNLVTVGAWQRFGVDFRGGALVRVRAAPSVSEEQVRAAVRGLGAVQVSALPDAQEMLLRIPLRRGESVEGLRAPLEQALGAALGESSAQIGSVEPLGPVVDPGLAGKVVLAVVLALGLGLAYLAVRFDLRQGLAAVGATGLDLLVTLGLIAALRVDVEAPMVAAVLAVLVYSFRDKAVVLDRIRETLSKKGVKRMDPAQLVERALNQAVPRSAFSALAALVPLAAFGILGPAGVRGLALVLVVGLAAATCSSLFLMAPIWIELSKGEGPERKKRARPPAATA